MSRGKSGHREDKKVNMSESKEKMSQEVNFVPEAQRRMSKFWYSASSVR